MYKIIDFWFWLSVIEFILIILLCYKLLRKAKKTQYPNDLQHDILKKSRTTKIDMNDIINNINMSMSLYKELSSCCHPDRFVNTPKEKIAEGIFQEISKNKRNYKELVRIKELARRELELEFQ